MDRTGSDAYAKPDALVLIGKTKPNRERAPAAACQMAYHSRSHSQWIRPSLAHPEHRIPLAAHLSQAKEVHLMNDTHQTFVELQQRMHEALRAQNPQWIEPDGGSPTCDDYERRLAELLDLVTNE